MKKLGQHFLINKKKIRQIVDALDLKSDDAVIEIGAGHGELTLEIKNQILKIKNNLIKIIAIEKDKRLAKLLESKFESDKNITIIEGDALKILPSKIQNYKVVGNIPYYISGYLLRTLGDLKNKPLLIVLTIQKEVAERIYAEKGEMNLLAASVQFWAKPEIVGYISKKDFRPAPEVDSAIIKLTPRPITQLLSCPIANYYKLIKILFKQPRKTILNNLKISNLKNKEKIIETLKKLEINPQGRPQDLDINQIRKLLKLTSYYL